MIDRTKKLRWRRRIRKRRQQVEDIGVNAEKGLDTHLFRRLGRLMSVWRFVASWLVLLVLLAVGTVLQVRSLAPFYQTLRPAPGGTYTEGIIGTFTSANPLYATSAADSSAAHLVFSGLMKYNTQNELVPDLAETMTIDSTSKAYTLKLRQGVTWHDGEPFTAKDVMFTYEVIKNPDARSPYFNTWKDVTVTQVDPYTVRFDLPNVLSTFTENLTNGIVPEHLLRAIDPTQLRTAHFNAVKPIGTGPFAWEKLEVSGTAKEERQEIIGLTPNKKFYRSPPKLGRFILRTFRNEEQMVQAFKAGELTSMAGLASVSDDVRGVGDFKEYSVPLTGEVMVFFKTSKAPLNEPLVRRALVQAINVSEAIGTLDYPVTPVDAPFLPMHIGYNKQFAQLAFNMAQAEASLDKAGWVRGQDGLRRNKLGEVLTFNLYAQNTSDYSAVSGYLQRAWGMVGVKVQVLLQGDADAQGVVTRHDYDAILYGISMGTDPDVFAYWHSSQAAPTSPSRLNLSEYRNPVADDSLEAGRTRLEPAVRAAKYQAFLKAWQEDAPALALYQPTFLYVTRGAVFNFEPKSLNDITGRYVNVENWMIRQELEVK